MSYLSDIADRQGLLKKKAGSTSPAPFGPAPLSINDIDTESIKARVAAERGTTPPPSIQNTGALLPPTGSSAKPGPSIAQQAPVAGTPPVPQQKSGILRRHVGDTAVGVVKGLSEVTHGLTGLADIALSPTGLSLSRGLESLGWNPTAQRALLNSMLSPEQRRDNKAVSDAVGFLDTVSAALKNPSTIFQSAVESVPSIYTGRGIAQGLLKRFPSLSPIVASALGEGAISAGQTAQQARAPGDNLSVGQAAISAGSGIATSLISVMGGGLAKRLGIADIDVLGSSKLSQESKKGILRRVIEGAISEGAIEELPQSLQEQVANNLASGRPAGEGVAEAGAMGMLAGMVMGGVANVQPGAQDEGATTPGPAGSPVLTDEQLAGIVPKPAEDAINAPPPEPKTISIINQRAAPEVQATVDDALSKRKIAPGTFTAVQTPANPVALSMDKAGAALGHRVIWVEGGDSLPKIIRGASTTNAKDTFIIVNTRMLGESADQIAPTVVVHELTHRVKAMDTEGYGKIDGAVFSRPEAQAEFDAYRATKPSLDESVAREEYVAEQVQKYGSDERFWADIFKGMEPTRVEAIVSAIREIAQRVKAALGMGDQPDAVYQAAVSAFQKMRVDGGVEAAKVEVPPVVPIETPPVEMQAPLTVPGESIPPKSPISVQPQPAKEGAANGLQKRQEEKVANTPEQTRLYAARQKAKELGIQYSPTTKADAIEARIAKAEKISATPAARPTTTQAAPASEAVSSPETKRGEKSATEKGAASISKAPELMTPEEYDQYERDYDTQKKAELIAKSTVSDSSANKAFDAFDKDKKENIIDVESLGMYFSINRGRKKGIYTVTDQKQYSTGFYSSQKFIKDATREEAVKWMNERTRKHSEMGTFAPFDPEYGQGAAIYEAIEKRLPFSAVAADKLNAGSRAEVEIPAGYVREGDRYVYKPEITKAEQDAAWRKDVGLPEEVKPVAEKVEKPVSPATMTPEALGTKGAESSDTTYLGAQGVKRDAEIEALPDTLSDADRQDAVDEINAKYEFDAGIIVQRAIVEHSPVNVKLADSTGYRAYLKKLGYVKRKDMLVFKGLPKSKNAAENAIAPDEVRFSESDSISPVIDTPDEDAVKMRDRAVNKWVEKDIGANPKWQYAQGAKEGHAQRFEKLWGKYKDIEKTIRATHNPDEVSKEDAPAFRFHLMRMWGDWNVANADNGYDPTTHEVADWAKKQARDFADYALSVGEEQKAIGRSISFIERWQRDAHTKVGMAVQLADVYEKMFRTAVGDEKYNEARQVSKDVMDALKKQLDASTAQAEGLLKDSNILTASLRKLTFMRKTKVRADAAGQAKYLKQLKMPSGLKLSEGEGASHDDILTALQIKALEAGGELSEADVTDFLKKNGIEGTHENAPIVLLAETYDSIYRGMQAESEGKPVPARPARAGGDIVQQINDRTAAVYGDITEAIREDIIKKAIKEGRNRAGIANELMKAGIPREQANFFSEQISVAAELSRKTALESLKARYKQDAPEKSRVRLNALERIMQAFRVADLATADKATDATDSPWSEVRQIIDSAFGFKKPIDKKFLDDAIAMHNEYLTFDAQGNHVGAADSYDKLMWHLASRYGSDSRSAFKSYIGANVLSGINTTVRNVVSTASRSFDSLVVLATKQMTEGISEVVRGDAAKGWAKMSAALVPFHIMFKAAPRGFGQALNMLKHGINPSEYRIGTDDEKIMGDPKVVNALEYHPAFQGKFNPLRAMKLVFRSLRAQDIFFSSSLKEARYAVERINTEVEAGATAAEAKSLVMSELGYDKTGDAYRNALKLSEDAGLTGIERDINIAIEIHRNLEPEAYELANRWSRVETFNDPNPERLIGRIADFLRHSTQDNTMWWIGMFARISANVTNYLVDTSAFGLPLTLKDRYIGRYKGNKNVTLTDSEFHERSIRGAYGLMWTVGVIAYAMSEYEKEKEDPAYKSNFKINGPGPRNPTANRLWLQNNEPWTITVGGRSFKYLYIGALASPLASAATISDEAKYGELDKADNDDETQAGVMDRWLPAIILGASNFISSQLPGQTAADLMTALYSGDTQKTRMFLEAQMASIGSAVVPYSGLVRYFDRTIDPTVYTSKNRMFLYAFFRNVPVVREMALFPKRTIFGDAATMPKNIQDVPIGERAMRLMGEALTSQLEKDDDLDFLFRAQRQFTAPQYDELKIPAVKDGQAMLTDMTPAQYDEFLVEFGKTLRTQVHAIRQGYTGPGLEQYVNRDNKDLAKRLSAARTAAMKMAMYEFWRKNGLSISVEKK